MSDEDRLFEALDKLAAGRSPRLEAADLEPAEQELLRMAQHISGSRAEAPNPLFIERLRRRIVPGSGRVSRRGAFVSGLGALAAGVVAGVGLDHLVPRSSRPPEAANRWSLVGRNGKWMPVATLADVPEGAIRSFSAGHVQGFLMNRNGRFRALSRMCTDLGCALDVKNGTRFVCPCHGAEFNLDGSQHYTDDYKRDLPSLPELDVRVNGNAIEVWGV